MMQFEELLIEITAGLTDRTQDEFDQAIEDAQRRICEFYDLDRCTVWQWREDDPGALQLTHLYQSEHDPIVAAKTSERKILSDSRWVFQQPDTPPIYLRLDAKAYFPWISRKIMDGEPVVLSRVDDLPDEAILDRELLHRYATKSSVVIPLVIRENHFGSITFAAIRTERSWSDQVVKNLELVARSFASALRQKNHERALRESEVRLSIAAESADVSHVTLYLESGRIWAMDNFWSLLGIPRDEPLTLDRFLEMVHEEDRKLVRATIHGAREPGQKVGEEFRLFSADGTMHWVVARGQLWIDPEGAPFCLTGVVVDISDRKQMEQQLQRQLREIDDLKRRLENENIYLQEEVKSLTGAAHIISSSDVMNTVTSLARQVAATDASVLILGETGTGKDLLARTIHDMSARKEHPLITVNCASLPPTLIEAELFGREKGAYTGALTRMAGRFELADKSTIFLDEIGELPLELQAKLLRVIEGGVFQRLGSTTTIKTDFRVIAATNRSLFEEVKAGRFRSDLYYRLNVFPIQIPPLRERTEDIPLLVWSMVREFQEMMGKRIERITEQTMHALTHYHWPGNVRELRNVIERAMIVSTGTTLEVRLPEVSLGQGGSHGKTLSDVEREQILTVLASTGWKVAGKGGAAELLGLERTTLNSKMKKLGIRRPTSL